MGFFSPCGRVAKAEGEGKPKEGGSNSRISEGTRVSSFPSKYGNLSNTINELILLNRERGTRES